MSERQAKKARKREAKLALEAQSERKKTSGMLRRRVKLIALILGLMLLGVSVYNSSREGRVTIINKAGAPLTQIKIDYPGGSKTFDTIAIGEKLSVPLVPEGPIAPDAPKGLVAIELRLDGGAPLKFRSFAAAYDPKQHQVFTAKSEPGGRLNLMPLVENQGPTFSWRALWRAIGIGQ